MPYQITNKKVSDIHAAVLVAPIDSELSMAYRYGLDQKRVDEFKRLYTKLNQGDIVVMHQEGQRYEHVMFVVQSDAADSARRLTYCYQDILDRAAANEWRSIALPVFSLSTHDPLPDEDLYRIAMGEVKRTLNRSKIDIFLSVPKDYQIPVKDQLLVNLSSYISQRLEKPACRPLSSTTTYLISADMKACICNENEEKDKELNEREQKKKDNLALFQHAQEAFSKLEKKNKEPILGHTPSDQPAYTTTDDELVVHDYACPDVDPDIAGDKWAPGQARESFGGWADISLAKIPGAALSPSPHGEESTVEDLLFEEDAFEGALFSTETPEPEKKKPKIYAQREEHFREYSPRKSGAPSAFFDPEKNEVKTEKSFSETLLKLIDERGLTDPQCYNRANVSRAVFNKIKQSAIDPQKRNYKPSKSTALALAVALKLTLDETNDLLKKAGLALSPSDTGDVIVEYFLLNRKYDIYELNDVLFRFDQPLLGSF